MAPARRLRLPGLPLRAWHEMAAQEEPGQTQGGAPCQDTAHQGRSLERSVRTLNRVLQGWFEYFKHSKSNCLRDSRGYTARQAAKHPAQAARRQRPRPGPRSSALAQRLLPRPRLALLSQACKRSVNLRKEQPPTGEPDAGNPPRPVRERGRFNPVPISSRGHAMSHLVAIELSRRYRSAAFLHDCVTKKASRTT